ncbi:MAG: bifunctional phosphopantothenoylcysteine decarboxylase/phosphopantothenate--cysteine ligase CoaBC [Gammaproteobacteria bacterium]|nr:bifunctional phosphopantothenoylcysteine decarboxylase/phosphopantothenate--cysteine ligase CoaBC [Gammaproteobacteria bacterium]
MGNSSASLPGRHIVLGITGGIAAYKTPDIVRRLRERGADVRVALTHRARQFVTETTLKAVGATLIEEQDGPQGMAHIDAARWADMVVVAPATAHFISRLASGAADDILTTLCLATEAPLLVAPAMNRIMWEKPVTQTNCRRLVEHGTMLIGPDSGPQACGETGFGRMAEPASIVHAIETFWGPRSLDGVRALVTAGPTHEPLDPVRILTNRSSGKMGYAIAAALARDGAEVTLVTGPTTQPTPVGVRRVDVTTAADMLAAVQEHRQDGCDLFVGTAAVADYRPEQASPGKIKKGPASLTLVLVRNPDILSEVARWQPRPYIVGFALETERLEEHARQKLQEKNLDLVVGNLAGPGTGIDSDTNALTLVDSNGSVSWPSDTKIALAQRLAAEIARRLNRDPHGRQN